MKFADYKRKQKELEKMAKTGKIDLMEACRRAKELKEKAKQ